MVTSGSATHNEKEIKTDWPVTDGITAGTTTQQGHKMQLKAKGINGVKSTIRNIERVGF